MQTPQITKSINEQKNRQFSKEEIQVAERILKDFNTHRQGLLFISDNCYTGLSGFSVAKY